MDQQTLNEFKLTLEKEKKSLTEQLASFAVPDKNVKGDWDAKYEDLGAGWDENSQEVTEYATRLPMEHILEMRLQEVSNALLRIEQGTYGICEICAKLMSAERLQADPIARACVEHAK